MNIEEARAIVAKHQRNHFDGPVLGPANEGYLDTLARLENARGLTAEEREAGDVIWADFTAALKALAEAFPA